MTEAPDQLVAVSGAAFNEVAAAIEGHGLVRDPDRGTVEIDGSGRPSLASWSGADGDLREVDYQHDAEAGIAWLAIRGKGAEQLAEALSSGLGAHGAGTLEEPLAGLMTRPTASRHHETVERSGGRWRMMQAAIHAYGAHNAVLVRSMIRAGLEDTDWRVRMTAMLAIGRLRIVDLAPQAMAANVPPAGKNGLSQNERRMLLALRQASHDLASDLPPGYGPGDGGEEEIAALRRDFQVCLHRLLSGDNADEVSPAGRLVGLLLGEPGRT